MIGYTYIYKQWKFQFDLSVVVKFVQLLENRAQATQIIWNFKMKLDVQQHHGRINAGFKQAKQHGCTDSVYI